MEQLNIANPYTDLNNQFVVSRFFNKIITKLQAYFRIKFNLFVAYLIAFFQGLTGLSIIAFSFLMKDILHFNPADSSRVNSLTYIPWMIKPVFGLLSDSIPVCGYRRKSYLIINSLLFVSAYLVLYFYCHRVGIFILGILMGSFNLAFCNVIGEALVVESSNEKGHDVATKNVSNFFLIKAFGNLISTLCSGYLLKHTSPSFVFLISSFLPLIICFSSCFLKENKNSNSQPITRTAALTEEAVLEQNGIKEKEKVNEVTLDNDPNVYNDLADVRKDRSHEFIDLKKEKANNKKKQAANKNNENDVYEGFEKVSTLKTSKGPGEREPGNNDISGSGTENYQKLDDEKENSIKYQVENKSDNSTNISVSGIKDESKNQSQEKLNVKQRISLLYNFIKQKEIYKPILFILAFSSSPSYDDSMFYFCTNVLNFDEIIMGRLTFASAIASILGITLYKKWLYKFGFKCIMFSSTVVLTIFSMIAIALVQRWNISLGVSDYWFSLTTSSFVTALTEINTMPLLILAANLCPKNIEGTTYALIMSVLNFGGFVSYNLGSIITSLLGITNKKFDNLWLLILISNLFALLPLPLLLFISDENINKNNEKNEEECKTQPTN